MSNVLAVAAVTQLLKDLINDTLINGIVSQVTGADFAVTALPPNRVVAEDAADQQTQLNLFLYRVSPNAALRNADLPTRGGSGDLVSRPRLALDLHYILTAVSAEELHAEILLGYAMQLFHEQAILNRETIRAALDLATFDDILPQDFDPLRASELADQIESAYLDVLADARREFDVPLAAYHVSGEYAMIKAAGERGWIDADRAMEEALVSIKRAGADLILSYAAADLAERI